MKETPQFKILAGMKGYSTKDELLVANIFYGASRENISNHWTRAKNVYRDVFRQFISAWYEHRILGKKSSEVFPGSIPVPPRDWETLKI